MLGPECAAIFVIFTAQVWNITFSFYQSLKTIPHDLYETAAVFQLSSWQRFWKIEVPCSMSGLLWNIMMSMSASWFFVVLSEAIAVAYQEIRLPGIGSYIARAIEEHNLYAVGYAIIAMVTVIFIYDQVLFRPLIAWSDKFKLDDSRQEQAYESWLMDWLRHSRLIRRLELKWAHLKDGFVNTDWLRRRDRAPVALHIKPLKPRSNWLWNTLVWLLIFIASLYLMRYIFKTLGLHDVLKVLFLGAITGARVLVFDCIKLFNLGARGGLDRAAAQMGAKSSTCAAIFGGYPSQFILSFVCDRHCLLSFKCGNLGHTLNDFRHTMVYFI